MSNESKNHRETALELELKNKRGYTKNEQDYSVVPVVPRVMIVESLCTLPNEGIQNLRLCLLDREDTQEFCDSFAKAKHDGSREDWNLIGQIQEYARNRDHDWINPSNPHACQPHQRFVAVKGTQYHPGDVITEKEAFDFGYVTPHIDTVVAKIVEASLLPGMTRENFTPFLRENGLISEDQTAVHLGKTIEIVANERARDFECGPKPIEQLNKSHTATIMVFRPGNDNVMSVGAAFLVPQKNTIYEFMTSLMVA